MLDYKDTLVLFGRSPFINEIKSEVFDLIDNYHTMGCNYFVNSYSRVEYVIFYDDIIPAITPYTKKIITNIVHLKDSTKKCHKLCYENRNKFEFYKINRCGEAFSKEKNTLNFYLHTPSMALNWAWRKGFRNVVLAGIDLNLSTPEHFDMLTTPDQNSFTLRESTVLNSRWHLENIATKYLNVYQLNPQSDMKLDKVVLSNGHLLLP